MSPRASVTIHGALTRAAAEAARRGDRRIATDHLLLGLLHERQIAVQLGTDLHQARAAAAELDRVALSAIGIDLTLDPTASPPARATPGLAGEQQPGDDQPEQHAGHMPLTHGVRQTMARAFDIAKSEQQRTIQPRHLLDALLERTEPDPAATLCRALHLTPPPVF